MKLFGFVLGPLLLIGAVVLLSWNEGRAVQALNGLAAASQAVVEADASAAPGADEGKLVHVVGPATASASVSDPDLNIAFPGQVTVARTVQMYQWQESKTSSNNGRTQQPANSVYDGSNFYYSYQQVWSQTPIDSSGFYQPGHANPPMPFQDARWTAADAHVGGYALSADTLRLATLATPLTPNPPDGWTAANGALAKGDPAAPQVGDLKVSYVALANGQTLSVLAQQSHGGFAPYTAGNGYQLEMVDVGNLPAAAMITEQRNGETAMTWVLRAAGFLGIFFGVLLFLSPLSSLVGWVPLVGSIARGAAFLAALAIAAPLTLIVAAISWIVFRPLVGIGLLVAAAVLLAALHWAHRALHPRAPAPAAV
jgi:hypothetical protein